VVGVCIDVLRLAASRLKTPLLARSTSLLEIVAIDLRHAQCAVAHAHLMLNHQLGEAFAIDKYDALRP
jgi:hypothetical protein